MNARVETNISAPPKRPIWRAIMTGLRMKCPACGQSSIYRAFLKVADDCPSCGLKLSGHEADDAPPYFTIFIVGHVIIPVALIVERLYTPPLWVHALIFTILSLLVTLYSLPRVKGAIIGWQWALRMHGFDDSPHNKANKEQ